MRGGFNRGFDVSERQGQALDHCQAGDFGERRRVSDECCDGVAFTEGFFDDELSGSATAADHEEMHF